MHLCSPRAEFFIKYCCQELWTDTNKTCDIIRVKACWLLTFHLTFHASLAESTTQILCPVCQNRRPGSPSARRWSWTTGCETRTGPRLRGEGAYGKSQKAAAPAALTHTCKPTWRLSQLHVNKVFVVAEQLCRLDSMQDGPSAVDPAGITSHVK